MSEMPEPHETETWEITINQWIGDDNSMFVVSLSDPDTEEERSSGEGWSLREAFIDLAENLNR